jgi:hypothetical protein
MNIPLSYEKRLLQLVLLVVSLIPLSAGFMGVWKGPAFFDIAGAPTSADSHMRYLSGLLLGIGLLVWWIVPRVEQRNGVFATITAIVFVGGLSRLWSRVEVGQPDATMSAALFIELALTPALYFWHLRIVRKAARSKSPLSSARPQPDLERP